MQKEGYIPLTDEMHAELTHHKNRTGLSARAIYNYMLQNGLLPKNSKLSIGMVNRWLKRGQKDVIAASFHSVISAYKTVDYKNHVQCSAYKVAISPEFRKRLETSFGLMSEFKVLSLFEQYGCSMSFAALKKCIWGHSKSISKRDRRALEKIMTPQKIEF